MADKFEQILDECIRLVLQGVPVQECLARYPEHAAELEPQLAAVKRIAAVYDRNPSEAAFARSRQRLQAEMAALEQEETEAARGGRRSASWLGWLSTGIGRWATVAAALMLVLITGAGTVAASANALPGELLYPVKQAAEEARLVLAFSDQSKAELHLAYAERRVDEMSALIDRGNVAALPGNATRLEQHLAAAGRLAARADDQFAQAFEDRLDTSAAVSLAKLEQAAGRAPGVNRAEVAAFVSAAGADYASVTEDMAARTEPLYVARAPGRLQVRAVDQSPSGVQSVTVEVRGIEVFLAAGSQGRWVTAIERPRVLDLLRIKDVQEVLGEVEVEAGTYTRVRFQVSAAAVVLPDGSRRDIVPEQQSLEVLRPLHVNEDKTTVVLLDFDGGRSLLVEADGSIRFDPKVLVRAADPAPPKEAGPGGRPVATPTPAQIHITGKVDSVGDDYIVVNGVQVTVDAAQVTGIVPGATVTIDVQVGAGGLLGALDLKVSPTPTPAPSPSPRPSTPTPTPVVQPTPTATPPQLVQINGAIQSLGAGLLNVAGETVVVASETEVSGIMTLGTTVSVTGTRRADGAILASRIEVLGGLPPLPTPTLPVPLPTATPTPIVQPTPTALPTPQAVGITGAVQSLGAGLLTVAGETVVVASDTQVSGVIGLGTTVSVTGTRRADGAILAGRIEVLGGLPPLPTPTLLPSSPTTTPTPVVQPTPTAPPTPQAVEITGAVQSLGAGMLTVAGETVVVGGDTQVFGVIGLGTTVSVIGTRRADGAILAGRIEVVGGCPWFQLPLCQSRHPRQPQHQSFPRRRRCQRRPSQLRRHHSHPHRAQRRSPS